MKKDSFKLIIMSVAVICIVIACLLYTSDAADEL